MSSVQRRLANMREAARILDEIKTSAGCVDCGFNAWPEALHFDHVDPMTKRRGSGWVEDRTKLHTRAKLDQFIEHVTRDCVIRCANCHAHRSQLEKHWQVRRDPTAVIAETAS